MSPPLARCAGATRVFGRFTAVDRVDLEIGPGEVVGLLGANGAGKTTLIRMLLGLLPVSSGQVFLFGEPPSRDTRRRIGYVPQGLGLYDDLTVAENLEFSRAAFGGGHGRPDGGRGRPDGGYGRPDGGRGRPGGGPGRPGGRWTARWDPRSRRAPRAARADRPGSGLPASLGPYAGVTVGALPLGAARRAAFAQALGHDPDLLILDEPTSGVDPLARARLWETIQAAAEAGAGAIVTTHYMEEAEECGRLVVMAGGRVVAEGSATGIVGGRRTVVVAAADWSGALRAVEAAGLRAVLSGTGLRVPGATRAEVERALAGTAGVRCREEPATLEERFFELAQPARAAEAAGGPVP